MTGRTDHRQGAPRNRSKLYARIALAAVVMTAALIGLAVASASVTAVADSAETADVFNDAGALPPDLLASVTWRDDDLQPEDRPVEPLVRDLVTTSWLRAWEQLRITAETGDTSGVAVSFSNSALDAVLAGDRGSGAGLIGDEATPGQHSLRQQSHDLQITFYSDDGSVIGLRSHATQLVHSSNVGNRILQRTSTEILDAVLILEDGSWRIHHLVRRSAEFEPWQAADSGRHS